MSPVTLHFLIYHLSLKMLKDFSYQFRVLFHIYDNYAALVIFGKVFPSIDNLTHKNICLQLYLFVFDSPGYVNATGNLIKIQKNFTSVTE